MAIGAHRGGASSLLRQAVGVLLASVFLAATVARAADFNWTGATDSLTSTPTNWSPVGLPGASDTAIFGTAVNYGPIVPVPAAISTVEFTGSQLYNVTVDGPLTVGGDGGANTNNTTTQSVTVPGTLNFQNSSSANFGPGAIGYAINSGAFLNFSNSSTAGTAGITNNAGGTTQFLDSSTAGNSTITNVVNGITQFFDTATAGQATIINNGGLAQFNGSSTAGNATITTNSGGGVFFVGSSSGGQAAFITNAGGVFDISGLTSGGMTAGSIQGAGNYLLGGNVLTVGGNNLSTTVSGVISDGGLSGGVGGSLIKIGTGTLVLSGNDTYTGSTVINSGTLDVAGSLIGSNSITVNSGGMLTGTGTVDPIMVAIASGATFTPGAVGMPGTSMTIAGNLSFQSGAIYQVYLNPSTASFANVSGTASLNGTVNASFASGNYVLKQYTILSATGGLSGAFSGLNNTNLPTSTSDSLSYGANKVYLNLIPGFANYTGLNGNQQNVANTLTNYFNSTGGIPATFFGLRPNGLTQIDGEAATGAERSAFQLMTEFLGLMLDPFVDGRLGGGGAGGGQAMGFALDEQANLPPDIALAYASIFKAPPKQPLAFDQRWTAWGAAYGGSNTASGDPAVGSSNVNAQTFGYAGGMDYHVTPDTILGFALAGGATNWDLSGGLGGGRSDAFQAGVYGITRAGPAYLGGALAFTNHWFTTNRAALGDQLTANFDAQSYGARVEAGYRYAVLPTLGVTPYGALQVQDFHTPGYSEADLTGGGLGLSYAAMNATDIRSELGARFDDPTLIYGKLLILRARVAWAHDWVSNPALGAVFESLPGTSFVVNGAPVPHDSALASAGAEFFLTPSFSLLAKFDGEFADGSQTYGGSGMLRYRW